MGNCASKNELNTFQELKESKFGRPAPRHGLKLLFWFAKDAVEFDGRGNMVALHDPRGGRFGFHHFGNFEKILPELRKNGGEKYFKVGNLKTDTYPKSKDLPDYVRKDYDRAWRVARSNEDRIIIRVQPGQVVGEVYVTEHRGWTKKFHKKSTYAISPSLIQMIRHREMKLATFLEQTGYESSETGRLLFAVFKCLLAALLFIVLFLVTAT